MKAHLKPLAFGTLLLLVALIAVGIGLDRWYTRPVAFNEEAWRRAAEERDSLPTRRQMLADLRRKLQKERPTRQAVWSMLSWPEAAPPKYDWISSVPEKLPKVSVVEGYYVGSRPDPEHPLVIYDDYLGVGFDKDSKFLGAWDLEGGSIGMPVE